MNLLLVNLPIREDLPPNTPNLGLAYVAAALREKGHFINVLDINGNRINANIIPCFINDLERQLSRKYDAILVSAMIPQFRYAKWFLGLCREEGLRTVLGGSLASSCPELMRKYTNLVWIGEGESFNIESYKDTTKYIYKEPPLEQIKDIDSLPLPALDLFPMENYFKSAVGGQANKDKWTSGESHGERSILILSSRGCPHQCIYCHHDFLGSKVRYRSVSSLISEIEHWRGIYNITSFAFADDNFTANRPRLIEFCAKFEPRGLTWSCAARLDALKTPFSIQLMQLAGCTHIGFGLESGSEKMIQSMKKGMTLEDMQIGIESLHKAGIDYDYTLVLGLPGEDMHTVEDTVHFIKNEGLKPPENIFFATAYPMTELWEKHLGYIQEHELRLQINPQTFFDLSNDAMWPGRLEKYLCALGENDERMIINFSKMDDSELMAAMEHMRRELGVKDRAARQPRRVIL